MWRKWTLLFALVSFVFLIPLFSQVNAGWVSGYFRSDGTWVNGYWRTEPNYWKWDNLSWDGDWSDAINDKSWYRDFGYDPEPWDDEIPNYSYWNSHRSWNSLFDYDYDYDYNWNSSLYDYDNDWWDFDWGWNDWDWWNW